AGALLCVVDMTQVFILNMTFGIPVKIISFHLLLLSLLLLTPERKRLVGVLFLNRAVGPSTQRPLFRGQRANGIAVVLQVALGLWLVGWNLDQALAKRRSFGDAAPKPVLYGIWAVDEFYVDGQPHPPLTTDRNRWEHLIIDRETGRGGSSAYQHMDGSLSQIDNVKVDTLRNTVTLAVGTPNTSTTTFTFTRPADDQLTLDGQWNRHPTHMQLHRLQLNQFNLVRSGFRWVYPDRITRAWD
ncbi:MAG: DoxX family protein, partial [Mycobacterium sp.]|nr:DoxX family protein [Mycobacterium sp.]